MSAEVTLAKGEARGYDPAMASDSILADALALPVSERARLVRVLSESIEDDRGALSEEDWLEAWGPVLSRRADELESGNSEVIDIRAAIAKLRQTRRSSK